MTIRTIQPCLLLTTIFTALPLASKADTAEEIIVTADFRDATLQTTAGSISVLDEESLQQQNARHLEEVLDLLPNVNFASGASRSRFYQIRGIGERSQFSEPMNASVGLLIDGVDFSGIGTISTLYDMEQVEVLMGPQGTRYGSNALAGLINLRSKAPTEEFTAGIQVGAGNQDLRELAGYVSGSLNDSVGFRLSAHTLKTDGYNTNLTLGKPTNFRDEQTLRTKLLWQINDTSSLSLNATLVDTENGYDAFSLDNVRDTLSDEPGFDQQQTRALSFDYQAEAGDLTLAVIGSTADSDINYGYDEDWTYVGFHPWEYSSTDRYLRERSNDSLELRLLSDSSEQFSWVTGVYLLNQEVNLERQYTYLPAPYSSTYSLDRTAAYIDTTTRISDTLSLDAGLRAERFEGDYNDSEQLVFNPADTLFGGRLALNYQLPGTLLFAAVSRGYKTGGFNLDGSLDPSLREFDAEYLWNVETGLKQTWPRKNLSLQATLFYMDRDEVQISSFAALSRNDGSTAFYEYTGNAAAGVNTGLETSLQWQASQQLSLSASLGLLKSEYEDFINSAGDDLDGREQAHAPSWQFSVTGAWQFTPALSGSMTVTGKDAYYFSDTHEVRSESYNTVNTELRWQQNNWTVKLWARNLLDEDYFTRGFYFGNDPRDGYTAKGYTQLGVNRRAGLTLNYEY